MDKMYLTRNGVIARYTKKWSKYYFTGYEDKTSLEYMRDYLANKKLNYKYLTRIQKMAAERVKPSLIMESIDTTMPVDSKLELYLLHQYSFLMQSVIKRWDRTDLDKYHKKVVWSLTHLSEFEDFIKDDVYKIVRR